MSKWATFCCFTLISLPVMAQGGAFPCDCASQTGFNGVANIFSSTSTPWRWCWAKGNTSTLHAFLEDAGYVLVRNDRRPHVRLTTLASDYPDGNPYRTYTASVLRKKAFRFEFYQPDSEPLYQMYNAGCRIALKADVYETGPVPFQLPPYGDGFNSGLETVQPSGNINYYIGHGHIPSDAHRIAQIQSQNFLGQRVGNASGPPGYSHGIVIANHGARGLAIPENGVIVVTVCVNGIECTRRFFFPFSFQHF